MDDEVVFRRVEANPRKIDPNGVPATLRVLIPFAERFGFSDYSRMQAAIRSASKEDRDALKRLVRDNSNDLTRWLDENVQKGRPYSGEHIAFSAIRMYVEME